jgi:hypothetical protein
MLTMPNRSRKKSQTKRSRSNVCLETKKDICEVMSFLCIVVQWKRNDLEGYKALVLATGKAYKFMGCVFAPDVIPLQSHFLAMPPRP